MSSGLYRSRLGQRQRRSRLVASTVNLRVSSNLARGSGEYRVYHLVERLPGVNGDRPGCTQAVLQLRQFAAQVFASVPDAAPVVVLPRIYSRQHGGLVDLQQEHLSEAAGQLLLVVRSAADVQRR